MTLEVANSVVIFVGTSVEENISFEAKEVSKLMAHGSSDEEEDEDEDEKAR